MPDSQTPSTFKIPDETNWEWWQIDRKGIWEKAGAEVSTSKSVRGYAFSAFASYSYPLWVNSIDSEIIEQVVPMELEEMGAISAATPVSHFDFRIIEKEADRTLVHAVVIPDDIEDPQTSASEFSVFAPAACLFSYPRNRIVIWKEAGKFVAAFTREGRLVHFHGFGKSPFSEDMVREIGLIYAGLKDLGIVDDVSALLSWSVDAVTSLGIGAVEDLLGLPMESAEKTPPSPLAIGRMELIPASVVFERENREKRTRIVRWGIVAGLVLALFVVGAFYKLFRAEQRIESLREKIAVQGPAAEEVRVARDRWEALHSAVEVKSYPVELFHRVASTLPQKGVQLTYFGIEGQDIYLKGEASTVSTAINVGAALKDSIDLKDYEWRFPSPDTSSAIPKFEATGIYRFARGGETGS